jgi:phosphoribosylformylglycinamidine cyclo-ligase
MERWINLYPPCDSTTETHPWRTTSWITREFADAHANPGRIACLHVEFEEGAGLIGGGSTSYRDAGVNVGYADRGIARIVERIKKTWPGGETNRVCLDIGYFANVVDIGFGLGLAMCTDGVGSKTIVCDLMNCYDTIGIDCVAAVVNDLICVGAKPISMTDYIAVDHVHEATLDQIAIGLATGAQQAGVSIIGGEVSQIPDIITGLDLSATAAGIVQTDRINAGRLVSPGDIIIGIESNGIHANGMTLARKVFDTAGLSYHTPRTDLGMALGMELLRPTHIYVKEILEILNTVPIRALANITGDGLLNLLRIDHMGIGFVIDSLPPPPLIFKLIQETGKLDDKTMFEVFNMGIGFCLVVSSPHDYIVMEILARHNRRSWRIGNTISDFANTVYLKQYGLAGSGKSFRYVESKK